MLERKGKREIGSLWLCSYLINKSALPLNLLALYDKHPRIQERKN